MKTYVLFCWLGLAILSGYNTVIHAQSVKKHDAQTQDQIRQVEQNLATWVQIEGQPNWTLAERMQHYQVKGLSIAVIHNYQIAWAKGYGWADTATQRPVTETMRFQAASLSKSLNAIGNLLLVQKGQVDLNADINRYLKRWQFPYDSVAHGKFITLGHLLSHTAGLSVHGFAGYPSSTARPSLVQTLDGLPPANSEAVRSFAEPGTRQEYSGGGTTISQLLVEDLTGQPYEQYMQEQVLKPLGMSHSTFAQPPTDKLQNQLATAYRYDGKSIGSLYHIYPEQAAAGLWTTPTDMARFVIEMQLSLQGKSNKVLSQKMTRRLLTPYIPRYDAALGTFIFMREGGNTAYFQHSGLNEGFSCVYYGSVEGGDGVVIMCNSDNSGLIREVANSVATVYNWKDFYTPVVKKAIKPNATLADAYIGSYTWRDAPEQTIRIYKQDGKLMYHNSTASTPREMHFTDNKTFFLVEIPQSSYEFVMDANENVDYIKGQRNEDEWKLTKQK